MADGDVKYRFLADAAAAERAIAALEKKYDALEAKIKNTARASKKGHDEGISGLDKLAMSVGKVAAGYVGVKTIINAATAAWEKYSQRVQEAIRHEEQVGKGVNLTSINTGVSAVDLKRFAGSVPGVLPEQALAAFQGVQAGAPQIPLEQQQAMARAISAMSPALAPIDAQGNVADTSQLSAFAETAATLQGFFKGKGIGDIADLTTAVQASVGSGNIAQLRSGKFEQTIDQLMAGGMTAERALASAAVGIDAGLAPKQLLGKGAVAALPQDKIAALEAKFATAQATDAAQQLLRDTQRVMPQAFTRQQAFSEGRLRTKDVAGESAALDELQELRSQRSKGFWQSTGALLESGREEMINFVQRLTGEETGYSRAKLRAESEKGLEKIASLLQENNNLMKQQLNQDKKPMQRNAQTE